MKKVNIHSIEGLEALDQNELTHFNGGESLWYWIAYGAGSVVRGVSWAYNDAMARPNYYMEIMIA